MINDHRVLWAIALGRSIELGYTDTEATENVPLSTGWKKTRRNLACHSPFMAQELQRYNLMDNCLFDSLGLYSQDYMYLDNSGKINGPEFHSIFFTVWNFEHTTIVPFLVHVFNVLSRYL